MALLASALAAEAIYLVSKYSSALVVSIDIVSILGSVSGAADSSFIGPFQYSSSTRPPPSWSIAG